MAERPDRASRIAAAKGAVFIVSSRQLRVEVAGRNSFEV